MVEVSSINDLKFTGIRRISLACGNFDGLHRGHQKIIDRLLQVSAESNSEPVVLTFHPHPREVLSGQKVPSLTALKTKKRLLSDCGIKALVSIPFTLDFAAKSAEDFVTEVLLSDGIVVTDICIGSDWHFGKGREGDVNFLKSSSHDFLVHPVEELEDSLQHISSSRIREALSSGDFPQANKLLGREYSICGPVIRGRGLATSELTFPTANIDVLEQFLPLAGVFACRVSIEESDVQLPAVCNIGYAPTFGGEKNEPARVEVHILDYNNDIYGKELEVSFVSFVRKEKKFANIQLLKQQIADDVKAARQIFSAEI
jgi:riboflavin kinase / FMN adenylyltransferase